MEIGTEMALRHLALRIALSGDGEIQRHDGGKDEAVVVVPGGSSVSFGRNGIVVLRAFDGRLLGSGPVDDPAFFASVMHNCDAMMGREYGPGSVEVVAFADAVIEAGDMELADAIMASTPKEREGEVDFFPLLSNPAVKAAADSVHPEVRSAYHAWRASRGSPSAAARWDDVGSLVRWSGRIARMTNKEDPLPSGNGSWVRIESACGRVEAARSLGVVEGSLGSYDGDRQLYALKAVGLSGVADGSIVAVAVFEEGELVRIIRHADVAKRPFLRLAGDLVSLIEAVEALHRREERPPRHGTWM